MGHCGQDTIHIVTDQAYWYPYTYSQEGEAKGIHIDMVQQALSNLNYTVRFTPKPWKRCLQDAKEGKYDAVVSASYKPVRAEYLFYPDDAAGPAKSLWRITQVEYAVITNSSDPYIFDGDVKHLPQPVRTLLGYSIADYLRSSGITVTESPDTVDCVTQLVKSGRGAFVTPLKNALDLQIDERFKEELKIHPKPVRSKSYFMVFAIKNQKINRENIMAIWNEIARLREDQTYMDALFNHYKGQR